MSPIVQGQILGPDLLQDFSEPCTALGELLALDGVGLAQVVHVVVVDDAPLSLLRRLEAREAETSEGIARDQERLRSPGGRPAFDRTLGRRHGARVRQELPGCRLPDVGRDVVPLVMEVGILVQDSVAADGLGVRVDFVGNIGVDQLPVGVEIERADMPPTMWRMPRR